MKLIKIKFLLSITATILLFSLTGCGTTTTTVAVNVENSEELNSTVLGRDAFSKIADDLWYDSATRIVYMKFYQHQSSDVFVPYYAPNGLPYRYNPETNTFEMIGES